MDEHTIPNRHFDVPFTAAEVVAAGEERWIFRDR
jgi:hypothetical protein